MSLKLAALSFLVLLALPLAASFDSGLTALAQNKQDREDLKKARAALRQGNYDFAARAFERLANARPESWEPRAGWVRALLEQGKRDDAARVCDDFLKANPEHAGARLALAQVALDRGEPERALELAGRHVADVRARTLAARALEDLERIDEAARMAEPLADLYARSRDDFMKDDLFAIAQGLVLYARAAGKPDLYKQVVQGSLPELLRADPGDAAIRAFQGRCFLEKYNRA